MEVWQTLEFIWDSQIEPFIELNMGLDNIIDRIGQTLYVELPVLGPPGAIPEGLVLCKFFADKDNVVVSFVSSSYYESFMQVLEALFHAFV